MGIKIEQISIKGLGPVREFNHKLGMLNLIYSKNEKGKTYITEFIIRSLFKNNRRWPNLRTGGNGKIMVSGLSEAPFEYSPDTKEKIEDMWDRHGKGLPPSMARLMVVKGAEAAIDRDGLNKHLIKEILSGINILDAIDKDNNISKTIKDASINNGLITELKNQGEGKQYRDKKNTLDKINKLTNNLESNYSNSTLTTYHIQKKQLEAKLGQLSKAKRHKAYLYDQKIRELERSLHHIPKQKLDDLSTNIKFYYEKKSEFDLDVKSYKKAEQNSKDYYWLEQARKDYEELLNKNGTNIPFKIIYPGIALLAVTIVLILSGLKLLSLAGLIISSAVIAAAFISLKQSAQNSGTKEAIEQLEKQFEARTGQKLTDISLIESLKEKQREHHSRMKVLEEQIKEKRQGLEKQLTDIQQQWEALLNKKIDESGWQSNLGDLKQKYNDLNRLIQEKKNNLSRLDVNESDYIDEDPGISYSKEEYDRINGQVSVLAQKIAETEEQMANLRYEICGITNDDPSAYWEALIDHLRQKKQETQKEVRELTAKIAGGIIVHSIIQNIKKEEDQNIQSGLASQEILTPLKMLTGRYNKLSLKNDELFISDEYDSFSLKDLSTGAREQVMLALRIGFSTRITKRDKPFLILDDAFQHSDWDKRETLIKQLVDLAENDWQVTYLTMDDHIRDLFNQYGKTMGNSYQFIEIQ